jgi:osmotically-inducible protein OsmY
MKGALMLTDMPLADEVTANLDLDPRIPDSAEVAVAADEGIVTLRGTVESFSQRLAAAEDAEDVDGVDGVNNELRVSPSGADRRDDDEIRGAALQNLIWDVDVPSDLVDVNVSDGWVTLEGTVTYQFESDAAYDDVASLYGVLGVDNEIVVTNP